MICPECNNSVLAPSLPVPSVLSYRGFKKVVASFTYLECSSCPYISSSPVESVVFVEKEREVFKHQINRQLSLGEEL